VGVAPGGEPKRGGEGDPDPLGRVGLEGVGGAAEAAAVDPGAADVRRGGSLPPGV
jgi:hypothetical protein